VQALKSSNLLSSAIVNRQNTARIASPSRSWNRLVSFEVDHAPNRASPMRLPGAAPSESLEARSLGARTQFDPLDHDHLLDRRKADGAGYLVIEVVRQDRRPVSEVTLLRKKLARRYDIHRPREREYVRNPTAEEAVRPVVTVAPENPVLEADRAEEGRLTTD
jgi:hypothetical protein